MVELPTVDLQVRRGQRVLAGVPQLLNALFLHGLAGRGSEWAELQGRIPARAPDLSDYGTRDDYVAQAVALIGRGPVLLIGQSLGAHTAFLVAARRPELVERLVVIEASPARDPEAPERVRSALSASPVPYGVELDPGLAAENLAEIATRDYWAEWESIRCPVLVVRGERGLVSREAAGEMVTRLATASLAEIADAGHDVHLERPAALADAIDAFNCSRAGGAPPPAGRDG